MTSPVAFVAEAVRRERARAGFSLTELARRAGIAKSTLSQLEQGVGNPGVETLWALAVALGVPFSRLVDPPVARVRLVRAGEGSPVYAEHADYASVLLSACPPNARRDLYLASAQPGAERLSEPHLTGTVEHVVIVTGRAEVGPTGEPVELRPGDYMTYPGDVPHVFRALEADTTAVMVSEHI